MLRLRPTLRLTSKLSLSLRLSQNPKLALVRMEKVLILSEMAATGTMLTQLVVETMTLNHGPQPPLVAPVEVDLMMDLLLQ
jgi:hypothetical protein